MSIRKMRITANFTCSQNSTCICTKIKAIVTITPAHWKSELYYQNTAQTCCFRANPKISLLSGSKNATQGLSMAL